MDKTICEKCCGSKDISIYCHLQKGGGTHRDLIISSVAKMSDPRFNLYQTVCHNSFIIKNNEIPYFVISGEKLFEKLSPDYFRGTCPYVLEHLINECFYEAKE